MPNLTDTSYVPPGVTTTTIYGAVPNTPAIPARIPLYVGTGSETLSRTNLAVTRGSSSTVDQRVSFEDASGRFVTEVRADGSIVLGPADGATLTRIQVRNFPLRSGIGRGQLADSSSVEVFVNGEPTVVLGVTPLTGIVEIAATPTAEDEVRVTYYFDRSDTRVTDDVSAQVTADPATIDGTAGSTFRFVAGVSDRLTVEVDGAAPVTIVLPATGSALSPAVTVAAINGARGIGTLVSSAVVNNFGTTVIRLTADRSLRIGAGTANGVFGFVPGAATARNREFLVFQGPIVTGNGGGVTSTNPSDVVVTVDGAVVSATAVDGANRKVTLAQPPAPGAKVAIRYWFNSWQDTFDYLPDRNILSLSTVGMTAEGSGSLASTYIEGVSYVLKSDRILWGSAAIVGSGTTTAGGVAFGSDQISTLLVDQRAYLAACSPTTILSGSISVASDRVFQLPYAPTTGNGRGSPLNADTFATVSNDRSDLPTSRPDLVTAYWGWDVVDAYARGPVTVASVDAASSTVTLAAPVPSGAKVFATFYYNTLTDSAFIGSSRGFTLTSLTAGPGGVGAYSVTDGTGTERFGAAFLGKGTSLATVALNFPSGSELLSDARIEGGSPVEETVTVTLASSDSSPAEFTAPGAGPYYAVASASDRFRVTFNNSDQQTGLSAGISLMSPTGATRPGAFASVVGDRVSYTAASGETTYAITAGVDDGVNLSVDGVELVSTATASGTATLAAYVTAVNAAAAASGPRYTSAGSFPSGFNVVDSVLDQLVVHYTGNGTGASGNQTITLSVGSYATLAELVTELNTQFATINGGSGLGGTITAAATSDSTIRFSFAIPVEDTAGYFEFITHGTPARDFAIVAGIDTGAATNGIQTKIYQGPIARRYTASTTSGRLPYDRIVLRNRIFPGSGSLDIESTLAQTSLLSRGGTGATKAGLPSGRFAVASAGGVSRGPTLLGLVGWSGGQDSSGYPGATFYDGSDAAHPANNVFTFTVNTTPVTVTFTSSGGGTFTPLGPTGTSGTILYQIASAISSAGLSSAVTVRIEGAAIRLRGVPLSATSSLKVGSGSANALLGFSAGDGAETTLADVSAVAGALMNHAYASGSFATFLTGFGADAAYFAGRALAFAETDGSGSQYLRIQTLALGSAASILFRAPSSNSAFSSGTRLGIVPGSGASGRSAVNGFYVTSSDPTNGSGSANTSLFHSGSGADGVVGQTYVDAVTGFTFTLLPRSGGLAYPTGTTATLSFRVSSTIRTDGNVPSYVVPGVELLVTNTAGVISGDTATIETFRKEGAEPAVGETYYVSYTYRKSDFSAKIFTRDTAVYAEYGDPTPDNPLSLAAYFAFLNGSPVFAARQVPRSAGSTTASESAYLDAFQDLSGSSLPDNRAPTVIVPLTPATLSFARALAVYCDLQSSARYRAERTVILGFGSGTVPEAAAAIIASTGSARVRFVYPDVATFTLTDIFGTSRNYLVDGRYPAAALAAATVATGTDPATPWESLKILGFTSLARRLSLPAMNALAERGATILTYSSPYLRVRHGVTSDVSSILKRTPTVVQVVDEISRRARIELDPYIGAKFLPQILNQIEGRLSEMFKRAVAEQIISSFAGVKVSLDPEDPTTALAEAAYIPVFPLLYIKLEQRISASR